MTAPAWPPAPDPIRHTWRCTRPSSEDHYRIDPTTGESSIVQRCLSCGAVERVHTDTAERGGPT